MQPAAQARLLHYGQPLALLGAAALQACHQLAEDLGIAGKGGTEALVEDRQPRRLSHLPAHERGDHRELGRLIVEGAQEVAGPEHLHAVPLSQ